MVLGPGVGVGVVVGVMCDGGGLRPPAWHQGPGQRRSLVRVKEEGYMTPVGIGVRVRVGKQQNDLVT